LACNLSGPRRIKAGAARDHFLGFSAVSGRGEAFKAGGRVVKNVTGYDLCKLLAGSYGTLAALTDVTIKVLPAPEKTRTVLVFGLDDAAACAAMTRALGSMHEVSGAAHLPTAAAATSQVGYVKDATAAVTALRVEGPGPSVEHRCAALRRELADLGPTEELHGRNSALLWRELADVAPLVARPELAVWRLSLPPQAGHAVIREIAGAERGLHYYDWGGGLVWLGVMPDEMAEAAAIRAALAPYGGHATLIRAAEALRAAVPVFQPLDPVKAGLSERVKNGFDPQRVLNPGRMYPGV
jgi:glycolate oxidase FAD binding subunit